MDKSECQDFPDNADRRASRVKGRLMGPARFAIGRGECFRRRADIRRAGNASFGECGGVTGVFTAGPRRSLRVNREA